MLTLVHGQAAGTTSETVTAGSVFAAVALLAVDLAVVGGHIGAVQFLLAQTAVVAVSVPLGASGQHLFSGIDRAAALGAFGLLNGSERHFDKS